MLLVLETPTCPTSTLWMCKKHQSSTSITPFNFWPYVWTLTQYLVSRVGGLLVTSQVSTAQLHTVASGLGIGHCRTSFMAKPRWNKGENLCRASYEPVFLATSSSHYGLNGAAKKQGSVPCSGTTGGRILWWAPGFLVPGVHIPLLSYSENNNLGIGVKGFCRYRSSPNSVDLKLGRIFRWAWHNDISP